MMSYEAKDSEPVSTQRQKQLHSKIATDIEKFERQLADLKGNGSYASFADIHTLKELIRTRQDMLKRLK